MTIFAIGCVFTDEIKSQNWSHLSRPSLNVGRRPLVAVRYPLTDRWAAIEVRVDLLVSDLVVLPVPVQIMFALLYGGHLFWEGISQFFYISYQQICKYVMQFNQNQILGILDCTQNNLKIPRLIQ